MPTTNHADASKTSVNSVNKLFQVPGFDVNTFVEFQIRNLEALNAANQALVQGLQTVAQRQGKLVQQSVKQFQELLSVKPASVTEVLVKRIDVAKTSYEEERGRCPRTGRPRRQGRVRSRRHPQPPRRREPG